jgi:hypothetical protein
MDDDTYYGGHGTHVAGIMGAVANNGRGVAGLNWQTAILPVKWLDSNASGSTSGLIAALRWLLAAKQAGVNVRVVNDSATFVGTAYSQALSEEIDQLGANNILFVTAAGNTGTNNDEPSVQRYPCSYERPNEICVTATDDKDELPSWAGYGAHTVQLGAPGVSIYSTLRGGRYGYLSGGSMASPQVAGAAALILSASPLLTTSALRADILENVDPLPSLAGRVVTGGRLDVCKALPGCATVSQASQLTFGKTSVGASVDHGMYSDYKIVHRATMPAAGSVSKLTVYAVPGVSSPSPQALRAVIYADAGGVPGALLASGVEVTYRGNVNGSGWFDLPFEAPVSLEAGTYWIGFITGATSEGMGYAYDSAPSSRAYDQDPFSTGPTDPFGGATVDSEQASIYATYTASLSLPAASATFGKSSVGAYATGFAADRKRVNRYGIAVGGSLTKLSIYLEPGGVTGQQAIRGVVYADAGGQPGALLGTSEELVFKSTGAPGWYDLKLASALKLAPGSYWIGVITGGTSNVAAYRYDWVEGSRAYNANPYTAGPSNPFGSATFDGYQTSLYATYTPG